MQRVARGSFAPTFNPLLPKGLYTSPNHFCPPFSRDIIYQPMYGTDLETSRVMLSSTVMSMLASVLAVEIDRVKRGKVDSCGLVVALSYQDERRCIRLANKCTI